MELDIRNTEEQKVTSIRFWDDIGEDVASTLSHASWGRVAIEDSTTVVVVESKEHALNLTKALEKAIELGWLK